MDSFLCSLISILIIFSCFSNHPSSATFAPTGPLCREKESNALLNFKKSLTINESVSTYHSARNKVATWHFGGKLGKDCCSWDGVECDKSTGHVIGLDLSSSFLFGSINSSSPIFTLVHLQLLNLADNDFNFSHIPSEIGSLSRLKYLNLSQSDFLGSIPGEIFQLSKLEYLDLWGCYFSGLIPASINNLSKLTYLDLGINGFSGQIPSLAGLSELRRLYLNRNNLLTAGDLIWLGNLTKLTDLSLSGIDLSGSILSTPYNQIHAGTGGVYSTPLLPKFKNLVLRSCNLKAFPDFLRYQDEIESIFLGANMISGKIPTWVSNISKESLRSLVLNNNFLTGFEEHQDIIPWSNLNILDLDGNMMQGPLPIPPPSVIAYLASNNSFTGKIPTSLCGLRFLQALQLDRNNLIGTIPSCFSNFTDSLSILKLGSNNLQGPIPMKFREGSNLKILDLSDNQLRGKVPRSLENCKLLRSLDLSNNLIEDEFPFWLGSLEKLQLLLLGSNKLYGAIQSPISEIYFPNLRIFDLSHNNLIGLLPGKNFQAWNAMNSSVTDQDEYVQELIEIQLGTQTWFYPLYYVMTITNKGVNSDYEEIPSIFTAIDLSSNKFEGEIPESIGILKGLELLNFSNNGLIGEIPSSLGKLNNLESLDISRNHLSGNIPQQLTELNFLAVLNISYNNLTGPIPKGKQFDTFTNDSYVGNSGLCGDPLSRKCGDVTTSMPPSSESGGADDGYVFPSGVDWIGIDLGYVSGAIVGVVIGRIVTGKYHDWFVEIFERKKHKHIRQNRRGRRNLNQLRSVS